MNAWTNADSDDLDREVRRLRVAEHRERRGAQAPHQPRRSGRAPRQKANGRWVAVHPSRGQRTFNTRHEAVAWLDQEEGTN
jgi:hypothetical protein